MFAHSPTRVVNDSTNAYETTYKVLDDNSVHFTSIRDLETFPWNFVIPLDERIPMVSAVSDTTHEFGQTDNQEQFPWELHLTSDGRSKGFKLMGLPGANIG